MPDNLGGKGFILVQSFKGFSLLRGSVYLGKKLCKEHVVHSSSFHGDKKQH